MKFTVDKKPGFPDFILVCLLSFDLPEPKLVTNSTYDKARNKADPISIWTKVDHMIKENP